MRRQSCERAMCERLVACAILVGSMAGSAAAAAGAPVLVRKAPAPIAAYDWTGIYIGGHVGAGFSYRDWSFGDGSISEAGNAAMIGGQIGFNYQVGKWVMGAELDASWGNMKDES